MNKISKLKGVSLRKDIPVKFIDGGDGSFVFQTDIEPPIFSYGNSREQGLSTIKENLISLYNDFINDGCETFSKPWLIYLKYFDIEGKDNG